MDKTRSARATVAVSLAACAISLSGCYVLPVTPDGQVLAFPAAPPPLAAPAPLPGYAPGPAAAVLQARLYPANDVATQTGVLHGTVTNRMTGKGHFQLQYRGETLSGEATRVNGDARRGVASAFGSGGAYMSCEYQMRTPQQGAGTCTFSNGAKYQVHIGG